MQKIEKQKVFRLDLEIKKLKKIYENYGINTADMSEEEFERLANNYRSQRKSIDNDLKESEGYASLFTEEDVIG